MQQDRAQRRCNAREVCGPGKPPHAAHTRFRLAAPSGRRGLRPGYADPDTHAGRHANPGGQAGGHTDSHPSGRGGRDPDTHAGGRHAHPGRDALTDTGCCGRDNADSHAGRPDANTHAGGSGGRDPDADRHAHPDADTD